MLDTPVRRRVAPDWDERVLIAQGSPHFMQSATWARARSRGPWRAGVTDLGSAGASLPALVFEREVPEIGTLRHLPRVAGVGAADVPALTAAAIAHRSDAFATKLELYQARDEQLDAAFLAAGWLPTRASQYRFAVLVELADGADAALARMKKRARAEIRVGERNGVEVERAEVDEASTATMLALVRITEERSGAFFRSDDYLRTTWRAFAGDGRGALYFARHDGRVVSGAFVATYGSRAWYKDGGSVRDVPNLMASRLLQWRIMQQLAADGITSYDLGHVPPPECATEGDAGIQTFKTAFAAVAEFQPAYLLPHAPIAESWRVGESRFLAAYRAETGDYWY